MYKSKLQDASAQQSLVQTILKKYKQFPSHICQLGITDTLLLSQLSPHHQTYAICPDKSVSQEFKNNVPDLKIYSQSLSSFRVPTQMWMFMMRNQQIHSIRNREKFFQKISDHMEPYGLFVFDMYTNKYFDSLVWPSEDIDIATDHVNISSRKKKKDIYQQIYTRFDVDESGMYTRKNETQTYISQPTTAIKKMMKPMFDSITFLDYRWRAVGKYGEHVVVVCQKGW